MNRTEAGISRRALLGAGAAGFVAGETAAQSAEFGAPESVAITSRPIAHFRTDGSTETRFGQCVFRGGLELSSGHRGFGGLSGIAMDAGGGGFLAITDRGLWLHAAINYEGPHPVALTNGMIAPMLDSAGTPLNRTRSYDTESLCLDNGVAYVGVERIHEVLRFDWAKERFGARGKPVVVPPAFKTLPRNRGCECLGVAPRSSPIAGALVAITERSGERNQPTKGFILTGPQRGEFQLALKNDFDATDLAFLPDGDMLVLERFYRPFRGVGMRIRRIDGRTIRPGALLDGPVMIESDMGFQIDNMEALGLHVAGDGEIVLTLLSDDNFSYFQRTLLLQFALAEE